MIGATPAQTAEGQALDLHRRRNAGVAGSLRLTDWIKDQPATKPHVAVDLDDVVVVAPTGGTTGRPKGVMNTHRSYQTAFAHFMIACPYDDEHRPVTLAAAPMTHTSGLLSIPVTARGGTVVVLAKPDPSPHAGRDPQAPGDRDLPAADGDLPAAGHS